MVCTAEVWSSSSHYYASLSQLSGGLKSFLMPIGVPVLSGSFANLSSLIYLVPALVTQRNGTCARRWHREKGPKSSQEQNKGGNAEKT